MVDGQLVAALDWRKKKGEESGRYSYRQGNIWYVVKYGPGYSQTWRVTQHDDEGMRLLLEIESKEESDAKDRTL